jgi:hypothetical protein
MSILCPGSYGEFAVTITKECFGAKFQILSVSYFICSHSPLRLNLVKEGDIPFCTLALTY